VLFSIRGFFEMWKLVALALAGLLASCQTYAQRQTSWLNECKARWPGDAVAAQMCFNQKSASFDAGMYALGNAVQQQQQINSAAQPAQTPSYACHHDNSTTICNPR
jgi:hypothetical protein